MGWMVLVLLAGLWGSILLPGTWRQRRGATGLTSVDDFERSMHLLAPRYNPLAARQQAALQRTPGRWLMVLEQPARVAASGPALRRAARRRVVLARLVALVPVALAVAVVAGGAWWWLPAVAVAALGAYVALLRRAATRAALRAKVRRLPTRPAIAAPDQAPQLRRGA